MKYLFKETGCFDVVKLFPAFKTLASYLLTACLLVPYAAPAEGQGEKESAAGELDQWHAGASARLFAFTDRIDAYFGDIRSPEQRAKDWFRLGGAVEGSSAEGLRLRQNLGGAVNLDALSDRLRFFFQGRTGDERENLLPQEAEALKDASLQDRSNSFSTSLGVDLFSTLKTLSVLDGGLRFNGGIDPFVRLKFLHRFDLNSSWWLEPRLTLALERERGFGQGVRFDFLRMAGADRLFRFRNEFFRYEGEGGMSVFEEISLFKELGRRAFIETFLAFAAPNDSDDPNQIRVAPRFRKKLWRDWIYGGPEAGLEFLEDHDYKLGVYAIFRLDFFFERPDRRFPAH